MKTFLFSASFFIAGLAVGIGIMFWAIWKGPDAVISQQVHGVVTMNVVYATLLHDKKYPELGRLLETNLDYSFVSAEELPLGYRSQSSARLVRGYYDVTGDPLPSEISGYLSGIKGTDVRRLAAAMTPPAR